MQGMLGRAGSGYLEAAATSHLISIQRHSLGKSKDFRSCILGNGRKNKYIFHNIPGGDGVWWLV